MFSLNKIELAAVLVFILSSALAYIILAFNNWKRKYEFWTDRNVRQVGFWWDWSIDFFRHKLCNLQDIYDEFGGAPHGGYYQGAKPFLMIKDPELVRRVLIKDFAHFADRNPVVPTANPLQRDMILNLSREKWKGVRAKLMPVFTSGKLRRMSILINECTRLLDEYLQRTVGDEATEIEVRGLFQKFTMDTIGICAFGINCSAIEDENSEFRRLLQKLNGPGGFRRHKLLMILGAVCPKILTIFNLKEKEDTFVEDFFRSLVADTIKNREEQEAKREDFMQLLINVRAEELKMLQENNDDSEPLFTEGVCMANAFLFFVAGFETTSTALSYCLYELAVNPEVMEKLYAEITRVLDAHDGRVDYDILKEMEYLDTVISETLRLHPPGAWVDRLCTKAYQLPDSTVVLAENTQINIPIACLHNDPRNFPNPQKFDPDRFSPENKHNIVPGSYLPFGEGPKACIAERFALTEMKAAIALIVSKYTVHACAKTEIPPKLNPQTFMNTPKTIYLKICQR